jgi:enoyl-CoA hydratase
MTMPSLFANGNSDSMLTCRHEGPVAVVAFDRPPLNLMTREFRRQCAEILRRIGDDRGLRAVVFRSVLPKAFSAGSDMGEFPLTREEGLLVAQEEHVLYDLISSLPQPTIAVIAGYALGGGLELALACDFRFVEASAVLGLPEVNLGVFPSGGGTQRLPRLVGVSVAKRLMFSGETFGAERAVDLGIADELLDDGAAFDAAVMYAQELAARPQGAVTAIKRAIQKGLEEGYAAGSAEEISSIADLFASEEVAERVGAFLAKSSRRRASGGATSTD